MLLSLQTMAVKATVKARVLAIALFALLVIGSTFQPPFQAKTMTFLVQHVDIPPLHLATLYTYISLKACLRLFAKNASKIRTAA